MAKKYHVLRDRTEYGPYARSEIDSYWTSGTIQPSDRIKQTDSSTWIPAKEFIDANPAPPSTKQLPRPLPLPTLQTELTPSSLQQSRCNATSRLGSRSIAIFCGYVIIGGISRGYALAAGYSFIDLGTNYRAMDLYRQSQGLGYLATIIWLAGGVFFAGWLFESYTNVDAMGQHRKHARWWAAWSWFVPIYCLYKPGAIAIDLEQASQRSDPEDHGIIWARFWWGLFLVRLILTGIDICIAMQVFGSLDLAMTVTWATLLLDIGLATTAALMIVHVNRCQSNTVCHRG